MPKPVSNFQVSATGSSWHHQALDCLLYIIMIMNASLARDRAAGRLDVAADKNSDESRAGVRAPTTPGPGLWSVVCGLFLALACGLALADAQESAPKDAPASLQDSARKPKSVTAKELAAAFVREHRSDIVFIKGKNGAGSGFIALMKGRKVLITNAHVIAAIKAASFELLDRSPLRLGSASIAAGHDLIAYVVLEGGTGIPIATELETHTKMGDAVVVLGNASGGGVVNTLQGELVGLGPDRIEITAPFELGNSGSPIIQLRTGKVIGVATYAKVDTLLSGDEKVRRFGYRLDSPKTWQAIDWRSFYTESELVANLQTATEELDEILTDFKSIRNRKSSPNFNTPAIRNAMDGYYNMVAQNSGDTATATRELLTSLRQACNSDVAAAKYRFTYDYFRRQFESNERLRGEFIKAIDKALEP
ncbi:MAG: hypothetical protein C5B50_06815 [Verrucomicrobia bacterium]|nr:MAG: hypothetical protein C5B50_06815 [Verrucomicrobiota bacterium]